MALYILQLCRADGTSPALEAFELRSDDEVLLRTKAVLDQHPSCDHVTVWCDDDFVMRLDRAGRAAPPLAHSRLGGRRPARD